MHSLHGLVFKAQELLCYSALTPVSLNLFMNRGREVRRYAAEPSCVNSLYSVLRMQETIFSSYQLLDEMTMENRQSLAELLLPNHILYQRAWLAPMKL